MKDYEAYGYMCMTDFRWELGEAQEGCTIYASIEELKDKRKCVKQCGIVKVKVTLEEEIEPGKPWGEDE